ncbi:ATP-binding protein [Pseudonocardia humida]|uniref:AAA family ATPase n=1 Tax=Pseudonocardia humida TaxID=2800819 RepID=A0ABT1A7S9_9PSEU|nr:AAA family ATPase [Pseudonocardia humida]MCO1659063.1 AAA family ATPase [Pseudonocardia humida]
MGGELIGRAHALAVAERELDRVAAGRGGLLLVSGEAGIGKSALAAEIGTAASRRGALVAAAACTDTEGTPGRWPWVQVVRRLARIADSAEWAAATGAAGDALDPLLGERSTAPSGGDESFRLHDALTTLLVTVAARRPVVVVLEDLQHADPASMQVLDFVTRHAWFEPVLVVATYRDTELEAAAHPGRPHLIPLLGRATQLRLTGLDHDGVQQLLARAGRDLDHAAVADVLRRTGGNPFFVEQTALLDGAPSAGVRDVVERRLEALAGAAPRAVDVLAAVAVAGHAFDPDVPALLTGVAVDGELAAAEAAALIVHRDGRWTFVHDIVREHLYARLPAGRRRDLHAALVEILRRRPATAPATVARHARLAVPVLPVAEAVPLLVAAAEAAAARLAAEEAVRHLRDALALIDRLEPPDPHLQAEIQLELAAQLDRAGEITTARETAMGVLAAAGQAQLRARAALQVHRLGNPGRPGYDEIEMLDAVLPGLADGPLRARVLAAAGMARIHQAVDRPAGVDLARRAVELARASGDPDALGWSLLAWHDGRWEPGTAAERLEVLDELSALARTHGVRELEGLAAFLRFVALLERGDPAVHDAFAAFRTLTDRTRLPRHRYLVASRSASLALLTGDLDRAAELIDDARDLGARFGEVDRMPVWRDQAWALHSLRGDHDSAREVARTAVPGHPFTALLEGLTAAATGDADRALSRLDDVERLMAGLPRRFGWMHLVYLCEVAAVTGDPALAERARATAGPVRDAWAVLSGLVWGPMAYWLARVDAATGRRAEAIDGHTAALRAAQRWGAQPWAQRAKEALAALDAGEPARPAAQFRRSAGVWTLAFADRAVHVPDAKGLHDIAALLAAPHTDVPAVDLLHGSVSTSTARRRPRTPGADPIIDETAREAYRRRLTTLDAEIDDALDHGDDHRAARLDAERDALLDELRRAAGLAGRTRRLGDERERARQTVTARIRDSIRRLRNAHPELATHLTEAVHTGTACSYRPAEPVGWQL